MPLIDPDSAAALRPELQSGERLLWAGRPDPSIVLHRADWLLIPLSLLWAGFSIIWEVAGAGFLSLTDHEIAWALAIAGIPFVIAGQYMVWGRFIRSRWKKRRTHYGVSDRRIFVVQPGGRRKVRAVFIESLRGLDKEAGRSGTGTLRFELSEAVWGWTSAPSGDFLWERRRGDELTFLDIQDFETVYRLVSELRTAAIARQA